MIKIVYFRSSQPVNISEDSSIIISYGMWIHFLIKWKTGWPDLGLNWVRLAPNWTNQGIFFRSDSVHLARPSQMYWIWSEKIPGFVPFGVNLSKFGFKYGPSAVKVRSVIDISVMTVIAVHTTLMTRVITNWMVRGVITIAGTSYSPHV